MKSVSNILHFPKAQNSTKWIVIIDDDCETRYLTKHSLETKHLDYNIFEANNALEFVYFYHELPDDHEVDLVILDMHMPIMSGFDFLEFLEFYNAKQLFKICIHSSIASAKREYFYDKGVHYLIDKCSSLQDKKDYFQSILQIGNYNN